MRIDKSSTVALLTNFLQSLDFMMNNSTDSYRVSQSGNDNHGIPPFIMMDNNHSPGGGGYSLADSGTRDLLDDKANQALETPYVSMEASPAVGPDIDEADALTTRSEDGIYDVTGFLIVCLVILIGDMSRGVFFPTLWPLVESLGGTTVTLGYAVAAFSFGRILVNPIFGAWSVSIGYSKTLLISVSVLILGTQCYAQVQNVGRVDFLIFAQTVLGVGSGTLGVTRAFVADVTAKRNRTKYMAWVTAVQYGGFTVTPFIGALFCAILGDRDYYGG